jgi:hypothetical protein
MRLGKGYGRSDLKCGGEVHQQKRVARFPAACDVEADSSDSAHATTLDEIDADGKLVDPKRLIFSAGVAQTNGGANPVDLCFAYGRP